MKIRKIVIVSLIIAVSYNILSWFYIFNITSNSNSILKQAFESFLTLPALISYAEGYGGGDVIGVVILVFFVTWILSLILTIIIYWLFYFSKVLRNSNLDQD